MIFDRIVCLVDGSDGAFASLDQACSLASPSSRIVAVVPLDRNAAAQARCQVGAVTSAWEAQAELVRSRAEAALRGVWGYARIVDGTRVSAATRAVGEEEGTLLVLPAASLRSGDRRRLLRRTDCTILISRAIDCGESATILVLAEDGLAEFAGRLANRLRAPLSTLPGPRRAAAQRAASDAKSGDLVILRSAPAPPRWRSTVEQSVANRTAASALIVRSADDRAPLARSTRTDCESQPDHGVASGPRPSGA